MKMIFLRRQRNVPSSSSLKMFVGLFVSICSPELFRERFLRVQTVPGRVLFLLFQWQSWGMFSWEWPWGLKLRRYMCSCQWENKKKTKKLKKSPNKTHLSADCSVWAACWSTIHVSKCWITSRAAAHRGLSSEDISLNTVFCLEGLSAITHSLMEGYWGISTVTVFG